MKIIKTADFEMAEQEQLAAPTARPAGSRSIIELAPGEDVQHAISEHLQETGAVHTFQEGFGHDAGGGGFHNMGHNYELTTSTVTIDYRHSGIDPNDISMIIRGEFNYHDPDGSQPLEVQWSGHKVGSPALGVITYSIS